jgi:(1->4)-alpha-D-glucan 1-alpha-D-glucosylmutase
MRTNTSVPFEDSAALLECFARIAVEKRATQPLSTYRLQFNQEFRFDEARKLVPYLSRLGISHCYASPILKARAGSTHGYDITDHNQLNPEIGTEEEFQRLVTELKAHGMGLIVDTVPNHMGVGYGTNPWWQDVLQNGRASVYADFFDIDWEPLKPELRNKVLIPILGNPYGEDLEQGNIRVALQDGLPIVQYFDKVLPLDPQTIPLIFEAAGKSEHQQNNDVPALRKLRSLREALRQLPPNYVTDDDRIAQRQREIPAFLQRLQRLTGESAELTEKALQGINGTRGDPRSFDALHQLLEAQAYRLAFWRVSSEEINYRRFFDINDLVGLRMENPRVFAETHKLLRRLLGDRSISGLRIDHPDGLLDPLQYFTRVQMLYAASRCAGPEPQSPVAENGIELQVQSALEHHNRTNGQAPLYMLVEKILAPGEHLPKQWPVDGTVGYDFANLVNGILIDSRSERVFTKLYHRIVGGNVDVDSLIYQSKKRIMRRALSSELNVLTHILDEISSQDRRARDFTRSVLGDAIRETIACFPVYRTYIDERGNVSSDDRRYIEAAIQGSRRRNTIIPAAIFDFLRSILLLEGNDGGAMMYGYRKQLYFTLKFQQLTGPVMAKGLEDTACYVYTRFLSVNEVGGSPGAFGIAPSEFHRANQERTKHWPHSMLTTSTHDMKRSEDVRARLAVLSEMPRTWAAQVMKWRRINRIRKVELADGRTVPDNNEEYLLYQALVGAWPLRMENEDQRCDFVARMRQYMEKAVHEAKVNVSWLNQDPDYTAGLNTFIERVLSPTHRRKRSLFWDSLQKFLPAVSYFGAINSLTQTLLKLTCPGVPDIYQGQELFDFSQVDPDNRRPVDFALRSRVLEELTAVAPKNGFLPELLSNYRDGRVKLWLTWRALKFRSQHRGLFQSGSYLPLGTRNGKEEHVVAFARLHAKAAAIVAVPRLSYTLMKGNEQPPIGTVWGDAELLLPPEIAAGPLRNVLTGDTVAPTARGTLLCRELFVHFPATLLSLS